MFVSVFHIMNKFHENTKTKNVVIWLSLLSNLSEPSVATQDVDLQKPVIVWFAFLAKHYSNSVHREEGITVRDTNISSFGLSMEFC